jgi:hypothetical protein
MGSLSRRLQQLEELYHMSAAEESTAATRSREELVSKAMHGTLDALAHLRRASVDKEPWRYSVEKLKDREPFTIACYIAALAHKEHPDEERAREILEEPVAEQELEGAPLWAMIDSLEATFNQMDEEIEKRGA